MYCNPETYFCEVSLIPECVTETDCMADQACVNGSCVTVEPEQAVDSITLTKVEYCYKPAEVKSTDWGQIAWSEANPKNPKEWGSANDLSFSMMSSCFSAFVDMSVVVGVPFGDLTHVKFDEAKPSDWAGASIKPVSCSIGGKAGKIGAYVPVDGGWPCNL
jgi:hypothetical protein